MKKTLAASACLGMTLVAPASAMAAQPVGGCPPSFDLMNIDQSADLLISAGSQFTHAELAAALLRYDGNGDELVCVMDLPDTKGTPSYVFNFVDNVAAD